MAGNCVRARYSSVGSFCSIFHNLCIIFHYKFRILAFVIVVIVVILLNCLLCSTYSSLLGDNETLNRDKRDHDHHPVFGKKDHVHIAHVLVLLHYRQTIIFGLNSIHHTSLSYLHDVSNFGAVCLFVFITYGIRYSDFHSHIRYFGYSYWICSMSIWFQ